MPATYKNNKAIITSGGWLEEEKMIKISNYDYSYLIIIFMFVAYSKYA